MKRIIFLLTVIFACSVDAGSKMIVDFDGKNIEGYKLYNNSGSEKNIFESGVKCPAFTSHTGVIHYKSEWAGLEFNFTKFDASKYKSIVIDIAAERQDDKKIFIRLMDEGMNHYCVKIPIAQMMPKTKKRYRVRIPMKSFNLVSGKKSLEYVLTNLSRIQVGVEYQKGDLQHPFRVVMDNVLLSERKASKIISKTF